MMTMTDISNCPKCGATVTVDTFQEGDPMGIFCSACGFVYFVPQEVDTVEELIAKWNSQPVIERLRAENAALLEQVAMGDAIGFAVLGWIEHGGGPKRFTALKALVETWKAAWLCRQGLEG
jgi:hypothetical protein